MIRRVARKILPSPVKQFLKQRLISRSGYQSMSYELLPAWPKNEAQPDWTSPTVIRRNKMDLAGFDVAEQMQNPSAKVNLEALSATQLANATLLDYGCGTGGYRWLLAQFPPTSSWSYAGADINPQLIQLCKELHPGIRFETIPNNAVLPFSNDEFDVVLASAVFYAIGNYNAFLSELHRITRRYLVIGRQPVWHGSPTQVVRQTVRYSGVDESHVFWFFNEATLEGAFNQAGFSILHHASSPLTYQVTGVSEPAIDAFYLLQKRPPTVPTI